jgi:shikimate dehydrogenase
MLNGDTKIIAHIGYPTTTFRSSADMLFEQIPAYLEFFGFPSTTPTELREVAEIDY